MINALYKKGEWVSSYWSNITLKVFLHKEIGLIALGPWFQETKIYTEKGLLSQEWNLLEDFYSVYKLASSFHW